METLLARNSARATDVTQKSLEKIYNAFQKPGSSGRDGVPAFERGNVFMCDDTQLADLAAAINGALATDAWLKEGVVAKPKVSQSSKDPFDMALRSFVSLCASADVSRAKAANDIRKKCLKRRREEQQQGNWGAEDAVRAWKEAGGEDVEKKWRDKEILVGGCSDGPEPDPDDEDESSAGASNKGDPNAFTAVEVNAIIRNLVDLGGGPEFDYTSLTALLLAKGGLSHKDWPHTIECGQKMTKFLGGIDRAKVMFQRTFDDGGWRQAEASKPTETKPWVVLVTGLNGIRKTTSLSQPWITDCLNDALPSFSGPPESLPHAGNAFFRQLDFMMAALAVDKFRDIYSIDGEREYSEAKAKIFSRYRMVSEMLGASLLVEAKKIGMNVMLETSGRDLAMYKYVDMLFPDDTYNKLAINFEINDIAFAEKSVDSRMEREMKLGKNYLESNRPLSDFTKVNMGGPYGSSVLPSIKVESERVWKDVFEGNAEGNVGKGWYLAKIQIDGKQEGAWTATGGGKRYEFVDKH